MFGKTRWSNQKTTAIHVGGSTLENCFIEIGKNLEKILERGAARA
jgi:hypothetical protein